MENTNNKDWRDIQRMQEFLDSLSDDSDSDRFTELDSESEDLLKLIEEDSQDE